MCLESSKLSISHPGVRGPGAYKQQKWPTTKKLQRTFHQLTSVPAVTAESGAAADPGCVEALFFFSVFFFSASCSAMAAPISLMTARSLIAARSLIFVWAPGQGAHKNTEMCVSDLERQKFGFLV